MLVLNNKIYELNGFKSTFSSAEMEKLSQCFAKIQEHIKSNYMTKNSRNIVELQLHYNPYTHSYLVIDFGKNEVYLSHRDHGRGNEKYFCTDEASYKGWKYTMCLIVVERWEEIKEKLENYFSSIKSVSDLCKTFSV